MDESVKHPEWKVFEEVEPPKISWKRAKNALTTTTNTNEFLTITSWDSRSRWVYGSNNNEKRIRRLRSTPPHGFDRKGNPWYAALLYPAPPDPIFKLYDLVGVVTWVGHIGCVWPSYDGKLMMPLVQALERVSQHFVVPVSFEQDARTIDPPHILLPAAKEVTRLLEFVERRPSPNEPA